MREIDEKQSNMCVCPVCNSTVFRVYITHIIDDARLYCFECGEEWP